MVKMCMNIITGKPIMVCYMLNGMCCKGCKSENYVSVNKVKEWIELLSKSGCNSKTQVLEMMKEEIEEGKDVEV